MEAGLNSYLKDKFMQPGVDLRQYSALELAYIGDCIFDVVVRSYLVNAGNVPVAKLHQRATSMVSAKAQMASFNQIKDKLTEEEFAVYKRGRNAKPHSKAKNASFDEYLVATGFEALIGWLYLQDKWDRIIELIELV